MNCTKNPRAAYVDLYFLRNKLESAREAGQTEQWDLATLYVFRLDSNLYDPTQEEDDWLHDARQILRDTRPDDRQQGVLLLAGGVGCMGEDLYLVDGEVDTTKHFRHRECKLTHIVSRGIDGGKSVWWCVPCDMFVDGRSDTMTDAEIAKVKRWPKYAPKPSIPPYRITAPGSYHSGEIHICGQGNPLPADWVDAPRA